VGTLADVASGTKMRIRSDNRTMSYAGLVHHGSRTHGHPVPDHRVLDDAVRTQAAILADTSLAHQLHKGFDDGVRSDLDVSIDDAGFRVINRHAQGH